MSILTVQSDQARLQWRETIEAAYVDKKDVVIERYGKPDRYRYVAHQVAFYA